MQCQLNHLYIAPQDQPGAAPQVATSAATRTLLQGLLPRYIDLSVNTTVPQYHGLPWRAEVDFLNDDEHSSHIEDNHVAINQTGVYIMWFVTCNAQLAEVWPPSCLLEALKQAACSEQLELLHEILCVR